MRLIDADELLENNTWDFFNEYGQYTHAGEAVKNAPTIEPKRGRWVFDDENGGYRCSACKTLGGKSDYCPNCGARMDAQIGEDKSHPFAESVMMGMDEVEE